MSRFVNYKNWVFISMSFHVGLIIFVIVINEIGFSFSHPIVLSGADISSSVNVDVVGLPNILKKDINVESETKKEMTLPGSKK
ncbi:MAG: hypothetical protein V1647_00905, partial [Pseudomonadota bacterium]